MNYLIVVDMQNDFIFESLGTKEAQAILPSVCKKVQAFEGLVIATLDTHDSSYLSTQEGKLLPVVHCVRDTEGWQVPASLRQILDDRHARFFEKPTFGSTALVEYFQQEQAREPIDSIELIGLCTDICVVSNTLLLKAFFPEVPIRVDAACCAGVTPESHEAALKTLASCQVIIEN